MTLGYICEGLVNNFLKFVRSALTKKTVSISQKVRKFYMEYASVSRRRKRMLISNYKPSKPLEILSHLWIVNSAKSWSETMLPLCF